MDEDTIPDHVDPQQHTHVPLQVLQMCQELSKMSMFDAFGKRPFPWQKAIITHLNLMTCLSCLWHPSIADLLVRSYRRRKVDGQGFVSWTVAPLLSLGEDQVIKINANSATGHGAVVAFHLDHCA
jgi:hypothetical protein